MVKNSNPLENQPFFIQYAYLDLNDKNAVSEFLNDAKEPAKQVFETYFPELADSEEFEMRLSVNSLWQAEIRDFLDAWYKGNIVASEKDKWLNEKLPQRKMFGDNLSEIGTEIYVIGLLNLDLMGFLADEISKVLNEKLEKCEASDCDRYFLRAKRGKKQRFCSERCRNRAAQRIFRGK